MMEGSSFQWHFQLSFSCFSAHVRRVDAAPDFNVEQVVSRSGSRTTPRATRHGEGYVAVGGEFYGDT